MDVLPEQENGPDIHNMIIIDEDFVSAAPPVAVAINLVPEGDEEEGEDFVQGDINVILIDQNNPHLASPFS